MYYDLVDTLTGIVLKSRVELHEIKNNDMQPGRAICPTPVGVDAAITPDNADRELHAGLLIPDAEQRQALDDEETGAGEACR